MKSRSNLGVPSAREVEWRCWKIAGPMDRRRLEGPRVASAQTAYFARYHGSIEFSCDPLCVDVEQKLEKPNGQKKER
jgi:hypothetical protein